MKLFAEQPNICTSEVIDESKTIVAGEDGQLTEAVEKHEPEYFLEGVFLQANVKNRNGRVYPLDIMKKEVERYDREYIRTNRAFGELNHPTQEPSINLDRVSHVITKIWQDGNFFKARAKILDTPCGRIVKAMIKEGCQLGVSSRALGSVTVKDGVSFVNDDFHLITAGDIVFEPSAQSAFPIGIINEDVEYELDEQTGEYKKVQCNTDVNEDTLIDPDSVKHDDKQSTELTPDTNVLQQQLDTVRGQLADANEKINALTNQLSNLKKVYEFDQLLKNIQ